MSPPTRQRPPGAAGVADDGTGGRCVEVDGTTTHAPLSAIDPTVAVTVADARALLAAARRSPLSGPERLAIGRLAARLGDVEVDR